MAPPAGESPLKQVNKAGQPKRSKLQASWDELAANPQLFAADTAPAPTRYFSEFYCLRPNRTVQEAALASIPDEDLVGKYRVSSAGRLRDLAARNLTDFLSLCAQNNVSELFIGGVKVLKDAPPADVTRSNAVEASGRSTLLSLTTSALTSRVPQTLVPLLRHIFARDLPKTEQDVMTVLAGSAERHDQVFSVRPQGSHRLSRRADCSSARRTWCLLSIRHCGTTGCQVCRILTGQP